jgi:hypothetical protein
MPNASQEVLDEIGLEQEKSLKLPERISGPQWMLMPVGLIGAGKSTVVRPLVEHFGLVRISTDEIREKLKTRGYSYEGSVELATALGKKYLGLGYSVAFDANTGSTQGLRRNAEVHEAFPEAKQIFIHIDPPDAFIIDKLRNYHHTWLFKDGDHAVESFLKNKKESVLPDLPFVYRFDPSKDNLPEQLEEGIGAIKRAIGTT